MNNERVNVFWFRRDFRLDDNVGLFHALSTENKVIPLFVFDKNILLPLKKDDARPYAILSLLNDLKAELEKFGSSLVVMHDKPEVCFEILLNEYQVDTVFCNGDYEPYAKERDGKIEKLLESKGVKFKTFKDQVIFEKTELVKEDGKPYLVFTPYMKKWKRKFFDSNLSIYESEKLHGNFLKMKKKHFPKIEQLGFGNFDINLPSKELNVDAIKNYHLNRDFPVMDGTTRIGFHLRFGSVSIRKVVMAADKANEKFLEELIWREFYMMILWHFPYVVNHSFKKKYDNINWNNNESDFERWKNGETGFPFVDAGMRQLNRTGFMHNRVRMITASFLTKNLLIDWKWGEKYFAEKLFDFELSSNNGGWQWAAGTGADAVPYFRIFNPVNQAKKFDAREEYIRKWVPEYSTSSYCSPMLNLADTGKRAIKVYKSALSVYKEKESGWNAW